MGMQTDVLSAHLSAAGTFYASNRTRLKGIIVAPKASTAATFEIRTTSATGPIIYTMDIASLGTPNTTCILIPGEGIVAKEGLYLTLSVGSVTGITIFYG
jgi:hypothetical protein